MLEVSQLSRKYGSFVAVDDVSFSIDKGEIVGLLGHNGAGKTTIMKIISGFLEANTGTVKVGGIDLAKDPKLIQKKLGYLPENLPVYPDMSVADYLDYVADLKGLKDQVKQSEIARVIRATDISAKLLAPIATLSRGFKQRVGVAQAILGRPKLLILDEPTNGLDPEQTQHMRDLIRDVAKDATVILSTHIMQEVEALCSRVLMLHGGRLALDAEIEELKQSNHLLVDTTLAANQVGPLESVEGVIAVDAVEVDDDSTQFRVTFEDSADVKVVASSIINTLVNKQQLVYSLFHQVKDLETLFREVSESTTVEKEVKRAA